MTDGTVPPEASLDVLPPALMDPAVQWEFFGVGSRIRRQSMKPTVKPAKVHTCFLVDEGTILFHVEEEPVLAEPGDFI